MGEVILKYIAIVLVIVLVSFNEVTMTQGRQINASNKPNYSKMNKDTSIHKVGAMFGESNGQVSAHRPTSPGNSPGVGHKKIDVESPDAKYYSVMSGELKNFKPTDPGHSPGVGHALSQNEGN